MVVANNERMAAGYQFYMGKEECEKDGNHTIIKKHKFTVIRHYKHHVLVLDDIGVRESITNADLYLAGLVTGPYILNARTGFRK
ncbi:MAG: hypothetical protein Q4G60_10555 [bacterium]|nr:hypothetical protein [bacterium]